MNNFEQHIKDQMQNFAPTPPPAAWAGVSSGLGTSTAAKIGGKLLLKWVAGILITGSVVTATVIYNNQSDSVQPNPTTQTAQQAAKNNTDSKVEANTTHSTSTNIAQQNSENKNNLNPSNEVLPDNAQGLDVDPPAMSITPKNEIRGDIGAVANATNNTSNPPVKKYNTTALAAPAKIELSDHTLCPDQATTATLQNCQGCLINWGDGQVEPANGSQAKHSYSKEGKYIVSIKGANEMVTVKKPFFNVDATFLNSTTVLYKITNPSNLELNVQFADGQSEVINKKEWKHTFSDVEMMNAKFSTSSYCNLSKEIPMKSDIVQPYTPNTFTPNNDGMNDKFEVDFRSTPLKFYHLEIIDIRGQTVFESFSPMESWDGNYKNTPMPEGTYTMQLIYQFEQFAQPEKPVKMPIMLKK